MESFGISINLVASLRAEFYCYGVSRGAGCYCAPKSASEIIEIRPRTWLLGTLKGLVAEPHFASNWS